MKRSFIPAAPLVGALLALILVSAIGCNKSNADPELERAYARLDSAIDQSSNYENLKRERIENLRRKLNSETEYAQRLDILEKCIDEYEAYQVDSALMYADMAVSLALRNGSKENVSYLTIRKADILAHAGIFPEAMDLLENVRRDSLPDKLLPEYYATNCALYQYLMEYSFDSASATRYQQIRDAYNDSVVAVTPEGSFDYLINNSTLFTDDHDNSRRIKLLQLHLKDFREGTRQHAIISSIIADLYNSQGDKRNARYYMALTAISDTRASVKENMSFRAMATMMYEDGDVERAQTYLKKSLDDANFFSARLRSAQTSRVLPIIYGAVSAKQEEVSRLHFVIIGGVCLLTVIFAVLLVLVWRLFKASRAKGKKLSEAYGKLAALSGELKKSNIELAAGNAELKSSNTIKETYSSLFMEYCSTALSALEKYHKSVRILAAKGDNNALIKKIDNYDIIEKSQKEFYARFDEAILHMYPNFLNGVCALLRPDAQPDIKPKELLNTELRIVALIRIGITDTEKIAKFLNVSVSTVYTYRSKIRKRAISPDTFDNDLMLV